MKTTKSKKNNLATPGAPLSKEEFIALIQEAEKGPFKSVSNLKKEVLAAWKRKYAK